MRAEHTESGWVVEVDAGIYVHLTAEWCDDFHRDQFAIHDHRDEVKHQSAALNKLRYHLRHGDPTAEQVEEWFTDFYGEAVHTRQARKAHGLKAVTRDGHADLQAVQEGAPVRPYNVEVPEKRELVREWAQGRPPRKPPA